MSTHNHSSLLSCWPDGFSRYYSIAEILRVIFANAHLDILDVGGNSEWMYKFLEASEMSFDLTIVDKRVPDSINTSVTYLRKDFFTYSFNKQYDAVINTDVLEHIPANKRLQFVDKCLELSKGVTVFSAPHNAKIIDDLEHAINDLYSRANRGDQQPWIKEHFKYGKLDPKMLANRLNKSSWQYLELDTNNATNWYISFAINLINQAVLSLDKTDALNRFYNGNINSVGDYEDVGYRKMFVAFKDHGAYAKHHQAIRDVFRGDTTQRDEFNRKVVELLIGGIIDASRSLAKTTERLTELETKLSDLQKLVADQVAVSQQIEKEKQQLSSELANLKSQRYYRYASKINRLIGGS